MASSYTSRSSFISPSSSGQDALVNRNKRGLTQNPKGSAEAVAIWRSRVHIPFHTSRKPYTFLGPITSPNYFKEHKSSHLLTSRNLHLGFKTLTDFRFLGNSFTNKWRTMPGDVSPSKNPNWRKFLLWLEQIEPHKEKHSKRNEIYDVIRISKQNLLYNIP